MKKNLLSRSLVTLLLAGAILPGAVLAEESTADTPEESTEQSAEAEDSQETEDTSQESEETSSTSDEEASSDASEGSSSSDQESSEDLESGDQEADSARTSTSNSSQEESKDSLLNEEGSQIQKLTAYAIKEFQSKYADADLTELTIKHDTKKEIYHFEFEGFDSENEYEFDLDYDEKEDQWTEKKEEVKALDPEDSKEDLDEVLDLEDLLSLDTIEEAVLAEHPQAEIVKYQLDYDEDEDQAVWELELTQGTDHYEVEVQAQTAEILKDKLDD